VAVSASLTGLTEGTTYHYRVAATNPGGTSEGDDQTFTTHSAPEFGRCAKVVTGTGKYGNSGCKSLGGKHNYEWTPGVVATRFTTKIKSGEATLETAKGWKMTCTGETSTGGYTGLKTVGDVVLTLTGCERSGEKCSSGLTAGEIDSNPLEGALGVDRGGGSSPTNKIGLDLFPNKGPAMEFDCGTTAVSIQGSVIVPVTPNRTSLTPVLKFAASKGKQKPESFVGKSSDVLEASFNGGSSEQAGLALVTTQTNEEPVEVNSVY